MEGFLSSEIREMAKKYLPTDKPSACEGETAEPEPPEPPLPMPLTLPTQGEELEGQIVGERETVSGKFKYLLDVLLNQHVSEVRDLQDKILTLKKSLSEVEGEVVHLRSQNEISKAPEDLKGKVKRSSHSFSEIQIERHKGLKEFDANSILDAMEDDAGDERARIERRFQTDINKCLRAKTTYITDASSEEQSEILSRRKRLSLWLQSNKYEMIIGLALCVNVLWMALELQVHGQETGAKLGLYSSSDKTQIDVWDRAFLVGDMIFTSFFCLDVAVRILVIRTDFFKLWLNYLDMAVSLTSLVEVSVYAMTLPINPMLFRLLRIGKLLRAVRVVHMTSMLASLQLLVKCICASINMLFWSFCLLTFFQCVAGMIVSTLCRNFIEDPAQDPQTREKVFLYFGTSSRCFLTMFEILFANWAPSCRVLVESVSEWFSVFFLVYRCILGFAVLNVVNAVFVQQTMKTASSDEELAFRQKEKDIAQYMRKVKRLFQTMDASGDGAINLDEFSKLVKSPKLKFWMSQLELEYHDMLSLFEFLDNGDGEITLMDFVEGASRLRGSAKALDIWRIETKIEVLFEEVFSKLAMQTAWPMSSGKVQDIFDKSSFRHIKSTSIRDWNSQEE